MDAALILCRALHYTAAIALFGVSVFQATAAPSSLAQVIEPPLRRLVAAAILVVCVTTLLWLLLEAAEVAAA